MAEQSVPKRVPFRRFISIVDKAVGPEDFCKVKKYLSNPNSVAPLVGNDVQLADELVEEISRAESSRDILDALEGNGALDGSAGSKQCLQEIFQNAQCSDKLLEKVEKLECEPPRSTGSTVINVTAKKSQLPINISDLLHLHGIEEGSLQCYPIWSSGSDGSTAIKVVQTICAFANDISDDSSGYVVIGVDHTPPSPNCDHCQIKIHGVKVVSSIEKDISDLCHYIKPKFFPTFSVEEIERKQVLAIHVPASEGRPHEAPRCLPGIDFTPEHDLSLFIRQKTQTVVPSQEQRMELYTRCSRVPFDKQKATIPGVSVKDIDVDCVCSHLKIANPHIDIDDARKSPLRVYQQLDIVARTNGHYAPRNVALLVFSKNPANYFSGAMIRILMYGVHNTLIQEESITGPVRDQIRECLNKLVHVTAARPAGSSLPDASEDFVSYPYPALKETIVNAVYHRGYGESYPFPTQVLLYPDRMEIISYPGPNLKFKLEDFQSGIPLKRYPPRNPTLGSLLRDMKMAEVASTGIPMVFRSMQKNKSPKPQYDFDEQMFRVVLPAHPQHKVKMILGEADYCLCQGNVKGARDILTKFNSERPGSGKIVAKLLKLYNSLSNMKATFHNFYHCDSPTFVRVAIEAFKIALTNANFDCDSVLSSLGIEEDDDTSFANERKELSKACCLVEESWESFEDQKAANEIFRRFDEEAEGRIQHNAKYCLCFGLVKMRLAEYTKGSCGSGGFRELVIEAEELLRRVLQMHHANDEQLALAHQGISICLTWATLGTEAESTYHEDQAKKFYPSLGLRRRIRTTSRDPRCREMPTVTATHWQKALKQLLSKTSDESVQTVVGFVFDQWRVPEGDIPQRHVDTAATLIECAMAKEMMERVVLVCKDLLNPSHSFSGDEQILHTLCLQFQKVFISSLASKHELLEACRSLPHHFESWLKLNHFVAKLCPFDNTGKLLNTIVLSGFKDLIADEDLLLGQRSETLQCASRMFQCCGEHFERTKPDDFSKIFEAWRKLADEVKDNSKMRRLVNGVIVLKKSGWSTEAHDLLDQAQKNLISVVEIDSGERKEGFTPIPEFELTSSCLQTVARKIGKEWKKVARALEVSEEDIDNNEHMCRDQDLTESACQSLCLWKKRKGDDATVERLHKALAKLKLEAAVGTLRSCQMDESAASAKQ